MTIPPLLTLALLTLLAGLAMPLGAWLASLEHIKNRRIAAELHHGVQAFGAGSLLSAIALVLVPEGMEALSAFSAVGFFSLGAVAFMGLDILLNYFKTPASQLAAMLADFIPESIVLGAAFALGAESAGLLVMLIAIQNLPEGFNAFRELYGARTYSANRIVKIFILMALFGPAAALSGYLWLAHSPAIVAAVMLFAAGGILYSIFQDIAPNVKLERDWAPPLGAVMGFVTGMLGFMLI